MQRRWQFGRCSNSRPPVAIQSTLNRVTTSSPRPLKPSARARQVAQDRAPREVVSTW